MERSDPMVREAKEVVEAAGENGGKVRLFGGIAIAWQCESALREPLSRSYGDIDLIATRPSISALHTALDRFGYEPAERFNALHGRNRLLFQREDTHVDVFVGSFEMCHTLDLRRRLEVHSLTLSLADLLLTKFQVAELNRKDATDIAAVLLDHAFEEGDNGINLPYITKLMGSDWGWWRTVTENLDRMASLAPDLGLDGARQSALEEQLGTLAASIEDAPKSRRWRMRARVGDRIPWRDEPEEIDA